MSAARILLVAAASGALVLSACSEIDQKAKIEKVYAGKKDTRAADDARFGGDRKKWETALAERSKGQNEYLRTDTK
jgi:outer membrane murein-binding lipoprotein Lpp